MAERNPNSVVESSILVNHEPLITNSSALEVLHLVKRDPVGFDKGAYGELVESYMILHKHIYETRYNELPTLALVGHREGFLRTFKALLLAQPSLKDPSLNAITAYVQDTKEQSTSRLIDTMLQQEPELSVMLKMMTPYRSDIFFYYMGASDAYIPLIKQRTGSTISASVEREPMPFLAINSENFFDFPGETYPL